MFGFTPDWIANPMMQQQITPQSWMVNTLNPISFGGGNMLDYAQLAEMMFQDPMAFAPPPVDFPAPPPTRLDKLPDPFGGGGGNGGSGGGGGGGSVTTPINPGSSGPLLFPTTPNPAILNKDLMPIPGPAVQTPFGAQPLYSGPAGRTSKGGRWVNPVTDIMRYGGR